jgi:dihydroorotate dehydrogenase (NAD+) catalytic subunit
MPKYDLSFSPPIMNAAGSLGFTPGSRTMLDWSKLGAFVTNPISVASRTPANGKRFIAFPGGFLLHTGYPNLGFSQLLRKYARHWKRSPVDVIVHLLAVSPEEVELMVRRLEMVEGVSALELGVSSVANADMVTEFTRAAHGELPVIVRLPLERAIRLAEWAMQAGAVAISLAPPRGLMPTEAGEFVQGRLYGPAIFPTALTVVQALNQLGMPVIGAGGIYTWQQINAMYSAGAMAVQLDGVLWRDAGSNIFQ